MSIDGIEYVKNMMAELEIPFQFMEWAGTIPDMYFVGEYQEIDSGVREESGLHESTFILTGFTRGSWLSLEEAKEEIEEAFSRTDVLENGNGIALSYEQSNVIPTGDAELKRIEININIKEWKVTI